MIIMKKKNNNNNHNDNNEEVSEPKSTVPELAVEFRCMFDVCMAETTLHKTSECDRITPIPSQMRNNVSRETNNFYPSPIIDFLPFPHPLIPQTILGLLTLGSATAVVLGSMDSLLRFNGRKDHSRLKIDGYFYCF